MKNPLFFALLIFAVIGLPAAVVSAQTLDAGCSPEMWGYMRDQADATRARNKAYEREILHRQQSTLYLTCFDQAMAISAKLGIIFSDNIYPNPPPPNTLVFPNITYPDWGATQPTLAMDLNTVVNPEFDNWLSAPVPAPALFNFLPQWLETTPVQLQNQLAPLAAAQAAIIASIASFQAGDAAQVASYNALVQQIDALVKSLPTLPLQALPNANTQYTTLMTQLQSLVSSIQSSRASAMGPLISSLNQVIADFVPNCTRIDDAWITLDPAYVTTDAGVFYPPEGQYYPFSPYYTLKDFLGYPVTTVIPGPPTPDFFQELSNVTDNAALKQALNDIGANTSRTDNSPNGMFSNASPLGKAGNSPLWPAPPTFFPKDNGDTYSAQDVIDQM